MKTDKLVEDLLQEDVVNICLNALLAVKKETQDVESELTHIFKRGLHRQSLNTQMDTAFRNAKAAIDEAAAKLSEALDELANV